MMIWGAWFCPVFTLLILSFGNFSLIVLNYVSADKTKLKQNWCPMCPGGAWLSSCNTVAMPADAGCLVSEWDQNGPGSQKVILCCLGCPLVFPNKDFLSLLEHFDPKVKSFARLTEASSGERCLFSLPTDLFPLDLPFLYPAAPLFDIIRQHLSRSDGATSAEVLELRYQSNKFKL